VQVTNTLEQIAPATVERLVADHDHIRGCESCKSDVLALTLSTLQPGYSSTDMGRILKRLDVEKAKGRARIVVAVLAAIDVVKQNPHHAA
jgi:competence protein ComFB